MPSGRLPINLFDAMRVIAERIDDEAPEYLAGYDFASRHTHGRVLDLACGLGAGTLPAGRTRARGEHGGRGRCGRRT